MYHIPKDIEQYLENTPFLLDFKFKLHEVFESYDREINYEDMRYIEGTVGWFAAFKYACKKNNLSFLIDYIEDLEWYDYDWFCGEFTEILLKHNIVKK